MNNNPNLQGCPAKMEDSRAFTDYRPSCVTENMIMLQKGLQSSYAYRLFLQDNAEQLMDLNRKYVEQKNYCRPCTATQVPYSQMSPLQN